MTSSDCFGIGFPPAACITCFIVLNWGFSDSSSGGRIGVSLRCFFCGEVVSAGLSGVVDFRLKLGTTPELMCKRNILNFSEVATWSGWLGGREVRYNFRDWRRRQRGMGSGSCGCWWSWFGMGSSRPPNYSRGFGASQLGQARPYLWYKRVRFGRSSTWCSRWGRGWGILWCVLHLIFLFFDFSCFFACTSYWHFH